MKLFLLVSDRRSGTNNLLFMLGQYRGVLAGGEIFHHARSYAGFYLFDEYLDHVADRLGLDPGLDAAARDAAITGHAHAHPLRAVATLLDFAAAHGRDHVMFKVFPGHLRSYQLDRIIGRFRPTVLLLLRTPLEAYVSLQKANALKTWVMADTTGLRVTLDADDYIAWHRKASGFYRFAIFAALARGLHPRILHYDDLYRARAAPQAVLETTFRQMGVRLCGEGIESLSVQDRSGSVFETIDNFDAFFARLSRAGMAHTVYQFDLFGRLSYFEYAAKSLLGPLRQG